jgi:uncharacterized membrane protein
MNSKFIIPLAFLFTFLTGGIAGWLIGKSSTEPVQQQVQTDDPEPRDREFRMLRNRMISELELTDEQREPFFEALMEHRREVRQVMNRQRRQLESTLAAEAETLHQSLSGILTQEQMQLWDQRYSRQALMERQRRQREGQENDGQERRRGWRR